MQVDEHVLDENNDKKIRRRKKQLYRSILQQMEFYFSDANLKKDRFLGQLSQRDPYVDLSVFLSFNKISSLTQKVEDIAAALEKSELLKLSENKTKVSRITPVQEKENEDECTIYVERLPDDTEHDWLKDIFSTFGTVDYVSLPKYKHNKRHKGFAFIEFKTSENAQKALSHFESIGCKLPTQMAPNQLVSIVNFEPSNNETKGQEHLNENIDKIESENNETDENGKEELNVENDIPERKDKKKRKLSNNHDEEVLTKKVKHEEEAEIEEDSNETIEESKKKRKRKKVKKQGYDFKQLGLRVLSKREWKQLRNKYLNMQRIKMKSLKENLHRKRHPGNDMQVDNSIDDTKVKADQSLKMESEPRFQYKPRCIVQFIVPESCNDPKKLKSDIREHFGVEFVDVNSGKEKGFIRFSDEEFCKKFLETMSFGPMNILEGQEEQEYWEKIAKDRSVKLKKNPNKKVRGREKLLKKAEQELGKHIRFEN